MIALAHLCRIAALSASWSLCPSVPPPVPAPTLRQIAIDLEVRAEALARVVEGLERRGSSGKEQRGHR